MTPKNLEGRIKGICLDCNQKTERPPCAYYCFPCAKKRQLEASKLGAQKVAIREKEKRAALKKSLDDKGFSH